MAVEASASKPKRRRELNPQLIPGLLMGAPAFLLLLVFLIGPFLSGFYFSLTDQRLISPDPAEMVGLRNYKRLLSLNLLVLDPEIDPETGQPALDEEGAVVFPRSRAFTRDEENYPQYAGLREWFSVDVGDQRYVVLAGDPTFYRGLVNNVLFALAVIPLQMGIGLGLAILVNQQLAGRNFFRTIYFAPVVMSMVVVSYLWRFLYDQHNGLINSFLGVFGLAPVNWLGDPGTALPAIIIMSVWQGVGMQMVLFLAGLQGIPGSLYEAASIDGANAWQKFRNVTLPGLRNTTIFIFVVITIAAFQLFTQPWTMTQGGPEDATTTTVLRMVVKGYREQDIAYAAAITVVFFFIILAINLVQRRVLREEA